MYCTENRFFAGICAANRWKRCIQKNAQECTAVGRPKWINSTTATAHRDVLLLLAAIDPPRVAGRPVHLQVGGKTCNWCFWFFLLLSREFHSLLVVPIWDSGSVPKALRYRFTKY